MNNIFIKKYKPKSLHEFGLNPDFLKLLQTSSVSNNINILLVGQSGSGKSSIIDTIINDYYNSSSKTNFSDNILQINNLKDQGINYYRNDVKNFCQTTSSLPVKKNM